MAKAINFDHTTQTHTHTHKYASTRSLRNMRYLLRFAATVSIWRTDRSIASFLLTGEARGFYWDTRTQHQHTPAHLALL